MRAHDILAIGASAGGVGALRTIAAGLPADLPAALLITLHVTPHVPSVLPDLLNRAGPIPAHHADDGERLRKGHIYVAPPNRHLLVREGTIALSRGPRENRARPAVDPMFRSAARAYGTRVIGVILSGSLDDGTAGMRAIKARGGITVAQSPASAVAPDMPRNAIDADVVDHVVALDALAGRLTELVHEPVTQTRVPPAPVDDAELAAAALYRDPLYETQPGVASDFSCPDCGGVLRAVPDPRAHHYRCQVGHAWNEESLMAAQVEGIEEALWAAVRALDEHAKLTRRVRDDFRRRGADAVIAKLDEQLSETEHHAREIRKLLIAHARPQSEEQLQ